MRSIKDINNFRVGDRVGFKRRTTMSQLFAVNMRHLRLDDVGVIESINEYTNSYVVLFDRKIGDWILAYNLHKSCKILKKIKR